jgi:hypothetical protein
MVWDRAAHRPLPQALRSRHSIGRPRQPGRYGPRPGQACAGTPRGACSPAHTCNRGLCRTPPWYDVRRCGPIRAGPCHPGKAQALVRSCQGMTGCPGPWATAAGAGVRRGPAGAVATARRGTPGRQRVRHCTAVAGAGPLLLGSRPAAEPRSARRRDPTHEPVEPRHGTAASAGISAAFHSIPAGTGGPSTRRDAAGASLPPVQRRSLPRITRPHASAQPGCRGRRLRTTTTTSGGLPMQSRPLERRRAAVPLRQVAPLPRSGTRRRQGPPRRRRLRRRPRLRRGPRGKQRARPGPRSPARAGAPQAASETCGDGAPG